MSRMDKSRVGPGDTVDLSNSDGNLVLSKKGKDVTFNLASDLKVTSLVAGNTFLDTNGLVITGGPSMTVSGIDAGQLKISHVADGAVTVTSTDAVNGSQLHRVAHTIAEHLGGDAHVNADGPSSRPLYTVQKKRYKTIYDAFGGVDEICPTSTTYCMILKVAAASNISTPIRLERTAGPLARIQ